MNKDKGFTIPELLAVIVLIGILSTIATASYNGISNSVKKRTLDSKLDLIKMKAGEYASDNDVVSETISVAKLINEGYLDSENTSDNNERISNPLGGFLDCYKVSIERSTDDYNISIDEDTSCEIANLDNISDKIDVYLYEGENNRIINYEAIGKNSDSKWTNKDVYLFVDPNSIGGSLKKITWKFSGIEYPKENINLADIVNTDVDDYANIFKVSSSLLLNTTIYVKVETEEGLLNKKVIVKIDKESPTVTLDTNQSYEKLDDNNNYKTISFNGSDGNGSGVGYTSNDGVYGYYLTKDSTRVPTKDEFNITVENNYTRVNENGTYYGYVIDAAGNISKEPVAINVNNVTYDKPVCLNPVDNTTWINHDYTFTYGCVQGVGTGCAYSPKTGSISEEGKFSDFSWDAVDNVGNVTKCSKKVTAFVDKTAPSCSIVASGTAGKNGWYLSDVTLTLKCSDSLSGMDGIGLSTNSNPDYNGKTSVKVTNETNGTTYYGYAKDKAGNVTKISKVVKIVKTPPSCSLAVNGPTNGYGDTKCSLNTEKYSACLKNLTNNWFGIGATLCMMNSMECVTSNIWYTGNVNVTMNTSGSFITGKTMKTPKGTSNNGTYVVNYDTKGVEVSGTVTNEAGLTGTCSVKFRRDASAPKASLAMDAGTKCYYTVEFKARYGTCASTSTGASICSNPGGYYWWPGNQNQTTEITCEEWTKNNYANSTNLANYLKTVNDSYISTEKVTGPTSEPYLSTNNARLTCSDSVSGPASYKINDQSGELYDLNSSSSGNSYNYGWGSLPTKDLTGICTDNAGNSSSATRTFEKYESEREETDCEDDHLSKTDCSSGSNSCADTNGSCSEGDEDKCEWHSCSEGSSKCDKSDTHEDCDTYTTGSNKWRAK